MRSATILFVFSFSVFLPTTQTKAKQQTLSDIETIVTTANRHEVQHLALIGNTSIIVNDDIQHNDPEHLNQLLSLASGAWLSRGNGQESLLSLRSPVLTGAGSCAEFLTLENGISVRSPGFCNVNQLFDTHFEAASSIEVTKGANSARYGSSAIHGAINVLSPNASTQPFITLGFGNNDYYRLNSFVHRQQQNSVLGAAFTATEDGGYQESSGYSQQKASIFVDHAIGDWLTTHNITLTHLDQQTAGYLQQGEDAYKDKSLLKINTFPDAYRNSISMRYSMKNLLVDDKHSWRITPYLRHTKMDFLMHFLPGTPIEENGHQSIGLQIIRNTTVNQAVSYTLGSDVDLTKGYLRQSQENDTVSNSAFLSAVLPKGAHYDFDVKSRSFGVFGQLDLRLSDKQDFFTALRYDYTQYDYTNNLTTGNLKEDGTACGFGGCRYTRPESQDNNFSDLSYSFGYAYDITKNSQLFVKYDDSFRAPHTSELYRLQNGQLTSHVDSVNAQQIELGFRFASKTFFSEISLYHLNKENSIYQDSDRQYLNGLETEHQGIEFDLSWQIASSFRARVNTSYAQHTYLNNPLNGADIKGNEIDTAPKLISNIVLDWQANDNVNIQLEGRHIDNYYLDALNTAQYGGHTIANLRTRWDISQSTAVRLTIFNIFDKRYAERADFAFGNYRYFIGEPKNFDLSINFQF